MLSVPATAGSGESVLEMFRIGSEVTVVVIEAPASGAVSLLSMLYAPFVIRVPLGSGLVTWTTSCTDPEPPAASAPTFQGPTRAGGAPPRAPERRRVWAGGVWVIPPPVGLAWRKLG